MLCDCGGACYVALWVVKCSACVGGGQRVIAVMIAMLIAMLIAVYVKLHVLQNSIVQDFVGYMCLLVYILCTHTQLFTFSSSTPPAYKQNHKCTYAQHSTIPVHSNTNIINQGLADLCIPHPETRQQIM